MYDMEHHPAIACPMRFVWQGNHELAEKVSQKVNLFALLMREERPEIDLSPLREIIFHHDFEQGIRDAAGSKPVPTPTKEAGGFSVGMLVRHDEDVKLVMHDWVAYALLSNDGCDQDVSQQAIRHELCHVDDFAFKKSLLAKHPENSCFKDFEAFCAVLAEPMWDEFYANKYSYGPWSDPRLSFDLLRDSLPTVRQEALQAVVSYRVHRDLDRLVRSVEPKARFIAQCIGYATGTCSAIGAPLSELAPEEHNTLVSLNLEEAWGLSSCALESLDAKRPEWDSMLELRALFPACLAVYKSLGLHLEQQEDGGTYINVPMTAETTPSWAGALSRLLASLAESEN